MTKSTLQERFEEKYRVDEKTGCWIWTGGFKRRSDGEPAYGQIWNPNAGGKGKGYPDLAPRVAWKLYRGKIPKGKYVTHTCGNPACVNPDHLQLSDKAAPRMIGERQASSKLTEKDVRHLLESYKPNAGRVTMQQLADEYKVSKQTISLIVQGKSEGGVVLTPKQVKEIRKKYQPKRLVKPLIDELPVKVSRGTVENILTGRTWKHVHKKVKKKKKAAA